METWKSISSDNVKVIDVSHYQGSIDWAKVAADGVRGAFIKATEGLGMMGCFPLMLSVLLRWALVPDSIIMPDPKTMTLRRKLLTLPKKLKAIIAIFCWY